MMTLGLGEHRLNPFRQQALALSLCRQSFDIRPALPAEGIRRHPVQLAKALLDLTDVSRLTRLRTPGVSDERCFWRSFLEVLRGRHAVGEGDGESVQGGLPPHGPSCLPGAFGV